MRIVFSLLAALALITAARAGGSPAKPLGDIPLMHEETDAAGLHSVYDGPWEFFVGGGGAALDCDGSGFPSVFLAGGKNPAKLYVNKSKAGGPFGSRKRRSTSAIRNCSPMSSAPIRSTLTATAARTFSSSGWGARFSSKAARTARSP